MGKLKTKVFLNKTDAFISQRLCLFRSVGFDTFKLYLTSVYKEFTRSHVRSPEHNSIGRSKLVYNLAFLKRCHDSNQTSPGLRISDPVHDKQSQLILHHHCIATT